MLVLRGYGKTDRHLSLKWDRITDLRFYGLESWEIERKSPSFMAMVTSKGTIRLSYKIYLSRPHEPAVIRKKEAGFDPEAYGRYCMSYLGEGLPRTGLPS